MSVRPVDMMTMLPRLHEAGRQQQNSDAQPSVAQHAATVQNAQKAVRDQQQVNHKSPAEKSEIAKDGGRGRSQQPKGSRRKKSDDDEPQTTQGAVEPGHRLDVKV